MTILQLIQAACKTKGVPEKYAERIQKAFKIEKAEGLEVCVDLFKENILPAISEAEKLAKEEAEKLEKEAIEAAAIKAYEEKHKIKDGVMVDDPNANSEGKIDPSLKAYLEKLEKKYDEALKLTNASITSSAEKAKRESVLLKIKDAKLPESWIDRVDLSNDKSLDDQIKSIADEYVGIQQKAIDDAVASGGYTPSASSVADRSESDWVKIMNGESPTEQASGIVDLGINK